MPAPTTGAPTIEVVRGDDDDGGGGGVFGLETFSFAGVIATLLFCARVAAAFGARPGGSREIVGCP